MTKALNTEQDSHTLEHLLVAIDTIKKEQELVSKVKPPQTPPSTPPNEMAETAPPQSPPAAGAQKQGADAGADVGAAKQDHADVSAAHKEQQRNVITAVWNACWPLKGHAAVYKAVPEAKQVSYDFVKEVYDAYKAAADKQKGLTEYLGCRGLLEPPPTTPNKPDAAKQTGQSRRLEGGLPLFSHLTNRRVKIVFKMALREQTLTKYHHQHRRQHRKLPLQTATMTD